MYPSSSLFHLLILSVRSIPSSDSPPPAGLMLMLCPVPPLTVQTRLKKLKLR